MVAKNGLAISPMPKPLAFIAASVQPFGEAASRLGAASCLPVRPWDIRRARRQFRRLSANLDGIGRGPTSVDAHVAADGPAEKREPLQECLYAGLKRRIDSDPLHPLTLLRPRRHRPRHRCTAEPRDELPPL